MEPIEATPPTARTGPTWRDINEGSSILATTSERCTVAFVNVQTLIARAAAAYARGDADAERICIEILSREPAQADATHLLGLVARQAGDLPRALSLLRTSVEQAPRNHEFRTNLGVARRRRRPSTNEPYRSLRVTAWPGSRLRAC